MADYSFDGTRLPATTLSVTTDEDTGRQIYTATATIVGLEPNRGTTAEERIAGITSLEPPTVTGNAVQEIIDLLERACLAAYDASGLVDVDTLPTVQATLAGSLRFSIAECFRQAGIDA